MPVIGTPVVAPTAPPPEQTAPSTVPCDEQNILTPEVSRYYSELTLARMRSVKIRVGQHARIEWTVVDSKGFPIDLTECGFPDGDGSSSSLSSSSFSSQSTAPGSGEEVGFRFRIRENLSLGIDPLPPQTEFAVSLVDAAKGKVRITLDKKATALPGVYFGELGVFDFYNTDDEIMLFSNVFYVIIERGQFGAKHAPGPPTIAEVRLHLRDSGPEENLLLDNIKFDDAEIALAIGRPLDYWNEIPPPLSVRATTQNFPYRYHWLEAICANLFFMAAENFRANNLTYSAAGVQVNDQNKMPDYQRAGERRMQEWKEFVRRKKAEINLSGAYGGIGSSYDSTTFGGKTRY